MRAGMDTKKCYDNAVIHSFFVFVFNGIILIILMLYFRVFATAFKRFSCVR